eukprot:1921023-Rhodomonas_salina.1
MSQASVNSVLPSHVSIRLVSGAPGSPGRNSVTVLGSSFAYTPQLTCRVGGADMTAARWLSSTSVVCWLPQQPNTRETHNSTVEVSNNGADFVSGAA